MRGGPPWGTPVLNWHCVDVCSLNVVYALRPLMYFAMDLIMVIKMCVCVWKLSCKFVYVYCPELQ